VSVVEVVSRVYVCGVCVVSVVSVSALCLSPTCESLALSQAGWLATGRADV
jgi:hypothetical protein